MAFRKISPQVKLLAIQLRDLGFSQKSIVRILQGFLSRRTFFRVLALFNRTGQVDRPRHDLNSPGRKRKASRVDIHALEALVLENPDLHLGELKLKLALRRDIVLHQATVFRYLCRAGYTNQQLKKLAAEGNSLKRAEFMNMVAREYHHDQLIFLDESSKDERTVQRRRGWGLKGQQPQKDQVFVRGDRFSILPAVSEFGLLSVGVVKGSYDAETFNEFILSRVLPFMNAYPNPLSVLVLDNCKIHHNADLLAAVEEKGARLIFLPPYSPDFMPCEKIFGLLKRDMRKYGLDESEGRWAALSKVVYRVVTPEIARSCIESCGYI